MTRLRIIMRLAALLVALPGAVAPAAAQFDHEHRAWDALLRRHVVVLAGGQAGQVRYAGFRSDAAGLRAYTETLSKVGEAEFRAWDKPRQMAFLINAYNAFTVVKVLQRHPDLRSIRDFGTLIGNPWKDRFFTLLGRDSFLDEIEHGMLRKPGAYEEPRVHFAVNCASVGCPMLREEAYVAERLDAQLADQERRFLSDRSRNRFNGGVLEVSRIFDWFKADWQGGWRGIGRDAAPVVSREQYFARHAHRLADREEDRRAIVEGRAALRFLDYDWGLNDVR